MRRIYPKSDRPGHRNKSEWSFSERVLIASWRLVYLLFFRFTPKKMNQWRLFLLRLFRANVDTTSFIFSSVKVFYPPNLTLGENSCLGPNVDVYNLGPLFIGKDVVISRYTRLLNGEHLLDDPNLPLLVGKTLICDKVFIGAYALLLPGIRVGANAVIAAGSVVTKDVGSNIIVGGNPAKTIGKRGKCA